MKNFDVFVDNIYKSCYSIIAIVYIYYGGFGVFIGNCETRKLAEYSDNLFCEKPYAPWNQDHRRQEGRSPTVFCPAGLDGMPGATGFEWNILSEYFHNFKFRNYLWSI